MPKRLVINDDNYKDYLGDGDHIVIDGQKRSFGCVRTPGRMRAAPHMTLAKAGINLIPESEWKSRATKIFGDGADLKTLTYDLDSLDQNGRGQCHTYGHCGAMRTLSKKQGGVYRCPSVQSVAYAIWGGRGWGNNGADPADSFEALMEQGGVRDTLWPMNGDGQSTRYATPTNEADRANNKLVVGVELGHEADLWTELVSCSLQGIGGGVAYNWWQHHVEWIGYLPNGNLLCRNSWANDYGDKGFFELSGSKKMPDGAWAFIQMTQAV